MMEPQIRFRTESALGAGYLLYASGVLVALLIVTWAALKMADRKGWLERWKGARASGAKHAGLTKLSSCRLSRQVSAHVISDGEARYIVVESSRGGVALYPAYKASPSDGTSKGPACHE